MRRLKFIYLITLIASSAVTVYGQALPLEPYRGRGSSITGAFEGWFKNQDGTFSFLIGYFNRNTNQELDIPIGSNNRIEPGGPDRGQPTHFLAGRQWGMFTVKVPADFGADNKLTWTITANGQTTVIPLDLKPDYEVSPFKEAAGNAPPVLKFEEHGATGQGPSGLKVERTAKPGVAFPLTVWVSDDLGIPSGSGAVSKNRKARPVTVTWGEFRGPASVAFNPATPEVEKIEPASKDLPFAGKATTQVTFTQPGEYELHVFANDYSGEGGAGFQCCWTNGDVKVLVKP